MRAAAAASLAADAAAVDAVDALERAGLEAVLLKGPALARLLYAAGEERSWDDADLLVDPAAHDAAIAILDSVGFHVHIADEAARGSVPHAVHLVREAGPLPESIDLHRSFAGVSAAPERFWESLRPECDEIELFGRPVRVPSVSARLALVALHAASHGRPALRSMRDLERAVRRFGPPEWTEAAALAGEWDALDYFVVGLRLDPVGVGLLAELGIDHEPGTAAVMRGDGMPRAQRGIEQLGRAEGVGERARLIVRKAFPSPGVMRIWKPLARRGRLGLALAYLWRPFWLVTQLGPAARSYARARRR